MMIVTLINNTIGQTQLVMILLLVGLLFSIGRRKNDLGLSLSVTNQLKGLAILAVIFGHIGYFLFADHNFLFPLSTISGIGVDIFFLLSGYGLAVSALKKDLRPGEFYQKRAGKIFLPLWCALILWLVLDAVVLGKFYDWTVILRSFFGLFPSADIYADLNSPLWYLTPLLVFYLIFPWLFKKRWALVSAVMMGLLAYLVLQINLPVTDGVRSLYKLHYLAFPVGVGMAAISGRLSLLWKKITTALKFKKLQIFFRCLLVILMSWLFVAAATFSSTELIAQMVSLVAVLALIIIFSLVRVRFTLLEIFGEYSYEIYLIHWPLLYHYDIVYKNLPAGWATLVYLLIFLGIGMAWRKLFARFSSKKN